MTKRQKYALTGGFIVVMAFLCHVPGLKGPFLLDDIPAVVEQPVVLGESPLSNVWFQTYWGDRSGYEKVAIYRPLVTLSFAVNQQLTPNSPYGFKVTNLLLHGLVSLLCWLLFMRFTNVSGALLGALIFAVHPIHVDAVAAVANRTELLAALFGLLSILGYLNLRESSRRFWLGFTLLCWVCALFSKESAIVLPPLLYLWEFSRTRNWWHRGPVGIWFALSVLMVFAYLGLRQAVLMDPFGGETPWQDNPLQGLDGIERWLTPVALISLVVELLFIPLNLSVDYTFNAFPVVESWLDARWWSGLVFMLGVLAALGTSLRRGGRPGIVLSLLMLVIPYGLVSHFMFPGTILFAERLLYFPSIGFALILALSVGKTPFTHRKIPVLLYAIALALLCWQYSGAWTSEAALFKTSLASRPESARLHANLGHVALVAGDLKQAAYESSIALEIDPQSAEATMNLGAALESLGRGGEALSAFKKGTQLLEGRYGLAHINYCRLATQENQLDVSVSVSCDEGVRLRSDLAASWVAHGRYYERIGEKKRAEKSFLRAVEREPGNPLVFHELAGYYGRQGDALKRWHAMRKLLRISPKDLPLREAVFAEGERLVNQLKTRGELGSWGEFIEAFEALQLELGEGLHK